MLAKASRHHALQMESDLKPRPARSRGDRGTPSRPASTTPQLVDDYQKPHPAMQSAMAGAAGYALAEIDPVVGALGNPIGIASYKPFESSGEDFLQNYFGMVGIPIEMYPQFPRTPSRSCLLRRLPMIRTWWPKSRRSFRPAKM